MFVTEVQTCALPICQQTHCQPNTEVRSTHTDTHTHRYVHTHTDAHTQIHAHTHTQVKRGVSMNSSSMSGGEEQQGREQLCQQERPESLTGGPQPGTHTLYTHSIHTLYTHYTHCVCVKVPAAVQESSVFGSVETAVRSCFNGVS